MQHYFMLSVLRPDGAVFLKCTAMKRKLYSKQKSIRRLTLSLKPSTFYCLNAIAKKHEMSMKRFIEGSLDEIWKNRHSMQTLY